MKVVDSVYLETHSRQRRLGVITRVGIPSGLGDGLTAYEVIVEGIDTLLRFYMKPELYSGKHYNVGNNAYWIVAAKSDS